MPMNSDTLGDAMKAAADAMDPGDFVTDPAAARTAMFRALAAAVVDHIRANAEVAVTVTSVTGVTTGAGTSGPGTGTGTIS